MAASTTTVSALFGLDSPPSTAWGQAWRAAAAAERELLALNSQQPGELGIEVRLAMALHAGTAAIGPLHWGAGHARLPVGPAVCDAMALRDLAAARGAWPAVSRTAAASSWPTDELAWQPVAPPEGHNGATLEAALLPSVGDATHGATHGATHVATRAARPHLSPFSPAGRLNVASASGLFAPVAASRHALRPWGC
jgi:hypothetical protein